MLFSDKDLREETPNYNELFSDKETQKTITDKDTMQWIEHLEHWEQYKQEHNLDIDPVLDKTLKHLAYLSPLEIWEVYEAMEQTPQDEDLIPFDIAHKQEEQEYIKHRFYCYNIWVKNKEGGDNE